MCVFAELRIDHLSKKLNNSKFILFGLGTATLAREDVLHSNLTEEEKTGLDPLEAEDTLVEIPDVDTLQLSDASIRKALEQLRPASTKQRGSISTGEGSKAASKYMERRRKCGTVDVHDVWKQSNLSVRLVERGVSFFGILSDEMCDKIHQFWEERGRYVKQRTTRIQPPNRKHLLLFSAESSHLPPDAKLKEVVEQLTKEEQLIEEEELREHQLAMQEPDIQNLTEQLLQAGVSLADSSLCHPTNDSQYRLTKSASERKSLAASAGFGRSKIEDAVIDRRRRRLKDLWTDEQPRPFTPMYFNICRPNVGRSTENAPELEEYSEPKDEHNEFTSDSETHVEQRETRGSLRSKSELSLQGEDVPYFLSDVLHAQLCCLLWLLRRMTTTEEEEKFTVPRPISMCWNYSVDSTCVLHSLRVVRVEARYLEVCGRGCILVSRSVDSTCVLRSLRVEGRGAIVGGLRT
ncbi:unnamed protein product [Dicrocoelium dendriticum]|nr:unnamed protein product [Dicrocoelium dendriticum]